MGRYPPKPRPGDKIAVLSLSGGLPEAYPLPYELGLRRLREDFALIPVEYPTTRRLRTTAAERAADLHAAFADSEIAAVIATIGGDDQITVLKHLDAELIRANPKPFFGYSDNTNLLNYLYGLGIVGYHGGSVIVQFGRGGTMHPDTEASLRSALFGAGDFELTAARAWTDVDRSWADPANLATEPPLRPGDGWQWYAPAKTPNVVVEGRLWGGCLEVLEWQLATNRWMLPVDAYDGVLFAETSEELPDATTVTRILRNLAERGLLASFDAVLWARPKAWSLDCPLTAEEGERFVADQYAADRRPNRQTAGGRDRRRGRAEGHRSLDGADRARAGHAGECDRRVGGSPGPPPGTPNCARQPGPR